MLIFSGSRQTAIAFMKPVLSLPGNFFDFRADSPLPLVQGGPDGGSVSAGPGGPDYHPAQMSVAGLGDGSALYPFVFPTGSCFQQSRAG